MNDDELRARLSRLDPAAGLPVDPVTSPRASDLLERIMSTTEETSTSAEPVDRPSSRGRFLLAAAAAVAVAAIGVGSAVVLSSDDEPGSVDRGAPDLPPVALSLPPGDVMSACMMFDVAFLREMPVALGGTATTVTPTQVTLDVDRWYKGGEGDRVTIARPAGSTSVALDGVEFAEGKRYLLTATEGNVNGCGYSGEASAELEKAYDEAFPR